MPCNTSLRVTLYNTITRHMQQITRATFAFLCVPCATANFTQAGKDRTLGEFTSRNIQRGRPFEMMEENGAIILSLLLQGTPAELVHRTHGHDLQCQKICACNQTFFWATFLTTECQEYLRIHCKRTFSFLDRTQIASKQ